MYKDFIKNKGIKKKNITIMKHKYNTSSCLSVFPPDPVSDTVANTAKNAQKNVGIKNQENKKIRKKN